MELKPRTGASRCLRAPLLIQGGFLRHVPPPIFNLIPSAPSAHESLAQNSSIKNPGFFKPGRSHVSRACPHLLLCPTGTSRTPGLRSPWKRLGAQDRASQNESRPLFWHASDAGTSLSGGGGQGPTRSCWSRREASCFRRWQTQQDDGAAEAFRAPVSSCAFACCSPADDAFAVRPSSILPAVTNIPRTDGRGR